MATPSYRGGVTHEKLVRPVSLSSALDEVEILQDLDQQEMAG